MASQSTAEVKSTLQRAAAELSAAEELRELVAQDAGVRPTLLEAVRELEKAIEEGQDTPEVRLQAGLGRLLIGHFRDAIGHCEQAGNSAEVAYHQACAYRGLADFAQAKDQLQKAKSGGLSLPSLELELIDVDRQLGKIDRARSALEKLPSDMKATAEYHYQLGACLAEEGETAASIAEFELAVELDPNHTAALFRLAWENDRHGNDKEAIDLYERCVSRPPIHTGALVNLGILYEDTDDWRRAVDCYQRVLDADPTHPRAMLFRRDAGAAEDMYYDEEAEKRQDRFAQLLQIPVSDFELSVRSRNCLKKMNVRNLGDLTRATEVQLLGSKNFGETSLREIKAMLGAKGLRLGQALEDGGAPLPSAPASASEEVEPEEETAGADSVLSRSIDELALSVRSRKCMERLNIRTIGELIGKTESQLLEGKNFGQTSLNEVRGKLAEVGLNLRR